MPQARKIQVHFDDEALQEIAELQRRSGATSMADVLRSALGLMSWAYDQLEQGYTVVSFREGMPVKEVVLERARPSTPDSAA